MRNETLVTSEEASVMLGVHRATFLRWAEAADLEEVHQMPGIRGAKLWHLADVEELAAQKGRLAGEKATA